MTVIAHNFGFLCSWTRDESRKAVDRFLFIQPGTYSLYCGKFWEKKFPSRAGTFMCPRSSLYMNEHLDLSFILSGRGCSKFTGNALMSERSRLTTQTKDLSGPSKVSLVATSILLFASDSELVCSSVYSSFFVHF